MNIWPARPKPLPGELLSSWIVRISKYNYLNFSSFLSEYCEIRSQNFPNFDLTYNPSLFKLLANHTNTKFDEVLKTSLHYEQGYVFLFSDNTAKIHWLKSDSGHSIYKDSELSYCPICISNDSDPFYRKAWRYSFNTVCSDHKIFLRQTCPHCLLPYNYLKSLNNPRDDPIKSCGHCNKDISKSQPDGEVNAPLANHLSTYQDTLWKGIQEGSFQIGSHRPLHSLAYMTILRNIAMSITTYEQAIWITKKYLCLEFKDRDLKFLKLINYKIPIESRSAIERAQIIALASTLFADWPERFLKYSLEHSVKHAKFFSKNYIPFWLIETAPEFFAPKYDWWLKQYF
jgi:hypothetical protein